MGLIPYIKTGSQHSADGMNDLYGQLDSILSTMTSDKSLYFMNGFSHYYSEVFPAGDSDSATQEDYAFGLTTSILDRTSSPKKYYFLDGAKHKNTIDDCEGNWQQLGYASFTDCQNSHCGPSKNCQEEALVPAGDWGWFYKLIGQYKYEAGFIDPGRGGYYSSMEAISDASSDKVLDYEKEIDPLMDAWVEEFLPIDLDPKQNLILGYENSLIDENLSNCDACKNQKWMQYEVEVCRPGTGPGSDPPKECEVFNKVRKYNSYIDCHWDNCIHQGIDMSLLNVSGSRWNLDFTRLINCDDALGCIGCTPPCPCPSDGGFCVNLQHALFVPKRNESITVYEINSASKNRAPTSTTTTANPNASDQNCSWCDDPGYDEGQKMWQIDYNAQMNGYNVDGEGWENVQQCYQWYCDNLPEMGGSETDVEICCGKVESTEGGGGGEQAAPESPVTEVVYDLPDARLITYDDLAYHSISFWRQIDDEYSGEDEIRFEHFGWCPEDNPDPRAYGSDCSMEESHGGKRPPDAPEPPAGYGWKWPCDMDPCPGPGCPIPGIPNSYPNLENRFAQAELIFDGDIEKYKNFKFSKKYDKYKFFRIHNLNNYDMEFEFEPLEELVGAQADSKGLFSVGDEKIAVMECSPGTGYKIKIPRHGSRCVRRDYGEYTTGYAHFQKILQGDPLYNLELSMAEEVIRNYPNYYDYYDSTHYYIAQSKSNNVINPFVIDDYINKFETRFLLDPHGPRSWDASGLCHGSPLDKKTTTPPPPPPPPPTGTCPCIMQSDPESANWGVGNIWLDSIQGPRTTQTIMGTERANYDVYDTQGAGGFADNTNAHCTNQALRQVDNLCPGAVYVGTTRTSVAGINASDIPLVLNEMGNAVTTWATNNNLDPNDWCVDAKWVNGCGYLSKAQLDVYACPNKRIARPCNTSVGLDHWDEDKKDPKFVLEGELLGIGNEGGTRTYIDIGNKTISGFQIAESEATTNLPKQNSESSYKMMTAPSHRNFKQIYHGNIKHPEDNYSNSLNDLDALIADFIYHTGWVLQTYNIKSGDLNNNCPSCVEKKLIPYSGARYVHDFINNLNVNVVPIEPATMSLNFRGDCGLSGFTAAPMQMLKSITHFDKEDVVSQGLATQQEVDDNKLALDSGPDSLVKQWGGGGASYTNAYSITTAIDPINHKGYSGVGPIESTILDYDSDRLGPKHLRFVKHHDLSPNSGDWVKTVGKHVGFWGPLKDRELWATTEVREAGEDIPEGILNQRQTLACTGLQEDIRSDHFEKARVSEIKFQQAGQFDRTKDGWKGKITCGTEDAHAENLGCENLAECQTLAALGIIDVDSYFYVEANDADEAKTELIKECKKRNEKEGVLDPAGAVKNCTEDNINENSIAKAYVSPTVLGADGRPLKGYGQALDWPTNLPPEWGYDNIDPYAYAIHQMPISTNILGQNKYLRLKGQIYPITQISEERLSDGCKGDDNQVFYSHIDFMNTHDINIGSYFYAKHPYDFAKKDLSLSTQGFEAQFALNYMSYTTWDGKPAGCYPMINNPEYSANSFANADYRHGDGCGAYTVSDVALDFSQGTNNLRWPFNDCPSWSNLGSKAGLGGSLGVYGGTPSNVAKLTNGGNWDDGQHGDVDGWGVVSNTWKVKDQKLDLYCKADDWQAEIMALSPITKGVVDNLSADGAMEADGLPADGTVVDWTDWIFKRDHNAGAAGASDKEKLWNTLGFGRGTFSRAPTFNEVGNGEILQSPMTYKYSFWFAKPRNHVIIGSIGETYSSYQKVGWDCTLNSDVLNKDWLSCGIPADWVHERNYDGAAAIAEDSVSQTVYGWPTRSEFEMEPDAEFGFTFARAAIPFAKSHLIPIAGGFVRDTSITQYKKNKTIPLNMKHDYLHRNDFSYYGWIGEHLPAAGRWRGDYAGTAKAQTSFEARRDLFGTSLRDLNLALKEFNFFDGIWTGYGVGMQSVLTDKSTTEGWDGSENEGPNKIIDGYGSLDLENKIPTVNIFGYEDCCARYQGAAEDCTNNEFINRSCEEEGNIARSVKYEGLTNISPPGGFELGDIYLKGNEEIKQQGVRYSSYNSKYFDTQAANSHWIYDTEGTNYQDVNDLFNNELWKIWADPDSDPFGGFYSKPVYCENCKFSYEYQKNINLRFKLKENMQTWGSDHMGKVRSFGAAYDAQYEMSEAKGVGYDNDGQIIKSDSPVVYTRYSRPFSSNRTPFGGMVSADPLKYPSVIQNRSTWQHRTNQYAGESQNSLSWFWQNNRVAETYSHLEPHADSDLLTGLKVASPFGVLYHPTGIFWNHPEIYMKEIRMEHVISQYKGYSQLDGAFGIIGYHGEYSPLDENFRSRRQIGGCLGTMPSSNRYMPYTDKEGPTAINWDRHLTEFGPPRRSYEITGALAPEQAYGYWPSCMAVYYAKSWIQKTNNERSQTLKKDCFERFFPGAVGGCSIDPASLTKLDTALKNILSDIDDSLAPSTGPYMSFSLIADGNVVYESAFAKKDDELVNLGANPTDSQSEYASLSKAICGAVIGVLIQKGAISKDDTLKELLPEYFDDPVNFPIYDARIQNVTVDQLANMQLGYDRDLPSDIYRLDGTALRSAALGNQIPAAAGDLGNHYTVAPIDLANIYPNLYGGPEAPARVNLPLTTDDVIRWFNRIPLDHEPGSGGIYGYYHNYNYLLLAKIVEKITNKTYDSYVQEVIFQPLGINQDGDKGIMSTRPGTQTAITQVYPKRNGQWPVGDLSSMVLNPWVGQAGPLGFITTDYQPVGSHWPVPEPGAYDYMGTASDYAKFLTIFDESNTTVLSKQTKELMFSARPWHQGAQTYYAYGQYINVKTFIDSNNQNVITYEGKHNGAVGGANSSMGRIAGGGGVCGSWNYALLVSLDHIVQGGAKLGFLGTEVRKAVKEVVNRTKEFDMDAFANYWIQYEDYCPTLQFKRWNYEAPHVWNSSKYPLQFDEPCFQCHEGRWQLHKDEDDQNLYNSELSCRARLDRNCDLCDGFVINDGVGIEKYKTHVDDDGNQLFSTLIDCRIAACKGTIPKRSTINVENEFGVDEEVELHTTHEADAMCCGRCDMYSSDTADFVEAYREMDIVPSGFPNINCQGMIDDIRLFEVTKDVMEKDDDGNYVVYDECQACTYNWDHGTHDSESTYRWGGDASRSNIANKGAKKSSAPDIRTDIMYQPAGIPHFYDRPPIMELIAPKLWPPPVIDGTIGWNQHSATMGCPESVIRPDSSVVQGLNPAGKIDVPILVKETWTGVNWVSGDCEGYEPCVGANCVNFDGYLDISHENIQATWMAERNCADHTAPCAGFDFTMTRDINWAAPMKRYFGTADARLFGRPIDNKCGRRIAYDLGVVGDWKTISGMGGIGMPGGSDVL